MDDVRKPAVAGMFYPEDKINLKRTINGFLANVPPENSAFFKKNNVDNIFGIIAPHAGYVYSGQVAAYGYSLFKNRTLDTVILIGPSHYNLFEGFALPAYQSFRTPLGDVEIDTEFAAKLAGEGGGVFDYLNTAHIKEHSLEVQIPFVQTVLEGSFRIVPVLMGAQTMGNVEKGVAALERVLKNYDKHYAIVISSDLSHYHNDREARDMDGKLVKIVEEMNGDELMRYSDAGLIEACGAGPICTLLKLANKMGRNHLKNLVYKNSGDVSGDKDRVVGYLSAAVW